MSKDLHAIFRQVSLMFGVVANTDLLKRTYLRRQSLSIASIPFTWYGN